MPRRRDWPNLPKSTEQKPKLPKLQLDPNKLPDCDVLLQLFPEAEKILAKKLRKVDEHGHPIWSQLRCKECGILIGPGHTETTATDGLCSSCYRASQRRKRARQEGNEERGKGTEKHGKSNS